MEKKVSRVVPARTMEFVKKLGRRGSADAAMRKHGGSYIWPENVVVQMRLADDIDLRKVSASRYNAYVPHRFETFTVRLCDQSNTTVLLFRTGRAVLAGTRAPEYTFQGAHRMRLDLAALGKDAAFEELRLVNQVYNTTLETASGIDLGKLYQENMDKTEWVPMMFPGLKYTDPDLRVKMRIFDTKRLVVMGSKDASEIAAVFERAGRIAQRYPDDNLPEPEERFDYRNEKKRLACCTITASDMVHPNT
jgi:TATA-box binding protein (TBP) (component of TFIID and TFIIIB)